jgi:hypothetical protein
MHAEKARALAVQPFLDVSVHVLITLPLLALGLIGMRRKQRTTLPIT